MEAFFFFFFFFLSSIAYLLYLFKVPGVYFLNFFSEKLILGKGLVLNYTLRIRIKIIMYKFVRVCVFSLLFMLIFLYKLKKSSH